jgi:hypothetical protein
MEADERMKDDVLRRDSPATVSPRRIRTAPPRAAGTLARAHGRGLPELPVRGFRLVTGLVERADRVPKTSNRGLDFNHSRKTRGRNSVSEPLMRLAPLVVKHGYLLETGEIVREGPARALARDARIAQTYVGLDVEGPPDLI